MKLLIFLLFLSTVSYTQDNITDSIIFVRHAKKLSDEEKMKFKVFRSRDSLEARRPERFMDTALQRERDTMFVRKRIRTRR